MRTSKTATLAAGALVTLGLAIPATAFAGPQLEIESSHVPSAMPAGTYAKYTLRVSNTGDEETAGTPQVEFAVPPGLEIIKASDEIKDGPLGEFGFSGWNCSVAPDSRSASCVDPELFGFPLPIFAGGEACKDAYELFFEVPNMSCRILLTLRADPSATPGTAHPTISACGGGDTACPAVADNADDPVEIVPFDFHVTSFDGEVLRGSGEPSTQAGSHPDTASTEFFLSQALAANGYEFSTQDLKDTEVRLPAGLVGNPSALETCTQAQLGLGGRAQCPPGSQVGVVRIHVNGLLGEPGKPSVTELGVYNVETAKGTPALFAFNLIGTLVQIYGRVRTGGDYGVTVISKNAPETLPLAGVTFTFWGVPADATHTPLRSCGDAVETPGCASPEEDNPKPFLTLPTSCAGQVETFLDVVSWQGGKAGSSFLSHTPGEPLNQIGTSGCNAVEFSPSLEARPTTNVADSPSGLDVDLHIPQQEECDPGPPVSCADAQAHLKDTTVTLPEGLVVNPAGANGLSACSEAQFGFTAKEGDVIHTTPDAATCSDESKLGTVEVDSPLVDHPLKGDVYIAQPYANPFNSLLAIYITIDDPATGVVVKLAGEVKADPNTGRLTTTVLHNPQLPFEDFKLHFFGGSGGSLRTPAACGTYSTSSSLTPWSAPDSGPPATPSDTWAISQAPGGGACPTSNSSQPNSPDLDAGSVSPIAASYSPAVVTLRRNDGSQEFSAVNLTLPPGMTGKLAGISQCADSALASAASKSGNQEKSSPSCPASSQIGTVDVAAGAGPAPYDTQGTAYLTGPYKGAPLGMAIVTPATAGPFDLGTVVVRVALHLNPSTGQITAVSDPIPSILQGIPLDIRAAAVKLDRPEFTRNGTSCNPSAFSGQLVSTLGQAASLSERFQLGECTGLAFKPKLGIKLIGGTKRGSHPALKGTVTMPEGGANIAKAVVALPHSEFLDQGHIGTVCTRVQFAEGDGNGSNCPAASVYGHAVATSPLVDYPLEGNAYLRSSSNKLPDLVIALHGPPSQPVAVDVVGRIDSIKGGIRTSFEGVPDLPVSSFVLSMEGGKKGLLQNSTNICKGIHKATAEFDAQNGKVADLSPVLKNEKCTKAKRKGAKAKRHRRAQQRAAR